MTRSSSLFALLPVVALALGLSLLGCEPNRPAARPGGTDSLGHPITTDATVGEAFSVADLARGDSARYLALMKPDAPRPSPAAETGDPFRPLVGTWEGTFSTYTLTGERISQVPETRTYWSVERGVQRGRISHQLADSTTQVSTLLHRRERGGLVSDVTGPAGKQASLRGTYTDGTLFWYRIEPGTEAITETTKERVTGDVLTVDGVGVYDETMLLFQGRYQKIR